MCIRGTTSHNSIISCHMTPFNNNKYCSCQVLSLLNRVLKKAVRLINEKYLSDSLQPLEHRRRVTIFYRYCFDYQHDNTQCQIQWHQNSCTHSKSSLFNIYALTADLLSVSLFCVQGTSKALESTSRICFLHTLSSFAIALVWVSTLLSRQYRAVGGHGEYIIYLHVRSPNQSHIL